MKKIILSSLLFVPAFAFAQSATTTATSTFPKVDSICVVNALSKKQNALSTTENTYNQSINTAIKNAIDKLNSAPSLDKKGKKEYLKQVKTQFQTERKNAKNIEATSKKTIQTQFINDVNLCGSSSVGVLQNLNNESRDSLDMWKWFGKNDDRKGGHR